MNSLTTRIPLICCAFFLAFFAPNAYLKHRYEQTIQTTLPHIQTNIFVSMSQFCDHESSTPECALTREQFLKIASKLFPILEHQNNKKTTGEKKPIDTHKIYNLHTEFVLFEDKLFNVFCKETFLNGCSQLNQNLSEDKYDLENMGWIYDLPLQVLD